MKPVAYMMESPSARWFVIEPDECLPNETCTPLYTHPMRELTDEEIKQIFQEQTGFFFDDNPADDLALMDFARAILKKASEK